MKIRSPVWMIEQFWSWYLNGYPVKHSLGWLSGYRIVKVIPDVNLKIAHPEIHAAEF